MIGWRHSGAMNRLRHPGRRALVCLVATVGIVLVPGGASAHAILTSSQPEAGQRLGTAPGVVVLEFSEPVNPRLTRATVIDPTGRTFTGGVVQGQELRVALDTNAPGVYTVRWVSVSTLDGHTIRGSFQFGVGVSPQGGPVEAAQTAPGPSDLAIALLRWLEYLELLWTVGILLLNRLSRRPGDLAELELLGAVGVLLRNGLVRTPEELPWVRRRPVLPIAIALLSGVAVVLAEGFVAAGSSSLGDVWSYLTTGLPGWARSSRLLLEAGALVCAFAWPRIVWLLLSASIVALAASGHGAAISPQWWGITVDAVHLLAAGVWAGGILALATVRPPGGWRSEKARKLLLRFSPFALTAFAVTVAFGAIQSIGELGSFGALFGSSYGQVLLVKVALVALMLPLSLHAWRRRRPHLRIEGALAVVVVAAAALLAAFPVPPSRLVEEEAARRVAASMSGLPTSGQQELTMGGHAGQVLVGLTLRPARPGPDEVFVYLMPLEGNRAAADLRAALQVGTRTVALTRCGDTCRRGAAKLTGDETVRVSVAGPKGGVATFEIPRLPPPDGSSLVARMMTDMHELKTYRYDETLSSGLAVIRSRYAFEAPDSFESTVTQSSSVTRTVWIGRTRYLKQGDGPWQVQRGGPEQHVPTFIWDFFRPFIDARIVGRAVAEGVPTRIVSFFGDTGGTPVWFRLWIDRDGLVRRAEMRAQGHFMDHRYYDFDAPIRIGRPI